jgi:PAS domain S-box-containing protein
MMVDEVAAARTALEQGEGRLGTVRAARPAIWLWELASGRVEWDEGLRALFGYAERVTDAAWRENRIHPEDRDRVKVSLQRATIVNAGGPWSDQYRFRRADGSYVSVTERAYVVHDDAGPRAVLGAIRDEADS